MDNKIKFKYFTSNINKRDKVFFSMSIFFLIFINMKDFLSKPYANSNGYDFLFHLLNNRFFSIFIIPPLVLLFLYKVNLSFNNYIFIRFNNRRDWFINSVKSISKFIFIFIISILIIVLTMCSLKGLKFYPSWSNDSIQKFSSLPNVLKYNPLVLITLQLLLFYGYLFTLSLLLLIFNIKFKNTIISFLFVIILNSFNIGILLSKLDSIGRFSFSYNLLLDFHNWGTTPVYSSIYFSIFYWIIIIVSIFLYGVRLLNKLDIVGKDI